VLTATLAGERHSSDTIHAFDAHRAVTKMAEDLGGEVCLARRETPISRGAQYGIHLKPWRKAITAIRLRLVVFGTGSHPSSDYCDLLRIQLARQWHSRSASIGGDVSSGKLP
jgi:hypothetical protein